MSPNASAQCGEIIIADFIDMKSRKINRLSTSV